MHSDSTDESFFSFLLPLMRNEQYIILYTILIFAASRKLNIFRDLTLHTRSSFKYWCRRVNEEAVTECKEIKHDCSSALGP
jgi:hypothetical protein